MATLIQNINDNVVENIDVDVIVNISILSTDENNLYIRNIANITPKNDYKSLIKLTVTDIIEENNNDLDNKQAVFNVYLPLLDKWLDNLKHEKSQMAVPIWNTDSKTQNTSYIVLERAPLFTVKSEFNNSDAEKQNQEQKENDVNTTMSFFKMVNSETKEEIEVPFFEGQPLSGLLDALQVITKEKDRNLLKNIIPNEIMEKLDTNG